MYSSQSEGMQHSIKWGWWLGFAQNSNFKILVYSEQTFVSDLNYKKELCEHNFLDQANSLGIPIENEANFIGLFLLTM